MECAKLSTAVPDVYETSLLSRVSSDGGRICTVNGCD